MDYVIRLKHDKSIIARALNPEHTDLKNGIYSFYCAGMLVQFYEKDVFLTSNNQIRPITL